MSENAAMTWQHELQVSIDDPGVAAHFPGMPLIAGFLQLSWVEDMLRRIAPQFRIGEVIDVKFLAQIQPPTTVLLEVSLTPDTSRAQFRITVAETLATKGQLGLIAQ